MTSFEKTEPSTNTHIRDWHGGLLLIPGDLHLFSREGNRAKHMAILLSSFEKRGDINVDEYTFDLKKKE
jgi:hypothetical protein